MAARFENMNNRNNEKAYNVTTDTKEFVRKFFTPMDLNAKGTDLRWNDIIGEHTGSFSNPFFAYQTYGTFVTIAGLDMIELLKHIYGTKDEDGRKIVYSVSSVIPQPVMPQQYNPNAQYQVQPQTNIYADKTLLVISTLDVEECNNICNELNPALSGTVQYFKA
jgi:hypothetical protein